MRTFLAGLIVFFCFISEVTSLYAISGPLGEKICLKGIIRGTRVVLRKRIVRTEATCPRGFTMVMNGSDYDQDGPYDVIPSGETVYGNVGLDYYAQSSDPGSAYINLPVRADAAIAAANVVVVDNAAVSTACGLSSCVNINDIDMAAHCSGSSILPMADDGYVCVYPMWVTNITSGTLEGQGFGGSDGTPYGFVVTMIPQSTGRTYFEGVWAFSAP